MTVLESILFRFFAVFTNELGMIRRSKTLFLSVTTWALIGVGIVLVVYACTEDNETTDVHGNDGGRESDDAVEDLEVFIDEKAMISQLPKDWQDVKKVPLSMTRVPDERDGADAGQDDWGDLVGDIHLASKRV